MDPSTSFGGWLGLLFVSEVPSSDAFALGVLLVGLAGLGAVHGSLAHHLARVSDLCRDLEDLYRSRAGGKPESRLRDLEKMMAESLVVGAWSDLLRKRHELEARSPDDGAPVRFNELLALHPLIPNGVRRSLLNSMPWLLAGLGISATLASLATGLSTLPVNGIVSPIVGLGLRGAFWGLILATGAGLASKLLEGSSQELETRLSTLVERTYRVVSQDEVSLRIAEAQLAGQERNSLLLLRLTKDLRESLNAGLGRIEDAATTAADVATQEQRAVLETVTQDLAGRLQHRLEDQLGALRTSMELQASKAASDSKKKKKKDQEEDEQTSAALERAARAVDTAAAALASSAQSAEQGGDLGQVAGVLEHAVEQIEEAQQEAGEDDASADALAGLRTEVTQIHEQMVESVMAARETRTGASAMMSASPQPAGGAPIPAPEAEESRSGYSALLQRYQAPRFSLDELAPELRTFDTDAAIERARAAGVAPDGSLVPQDDNPASPASRDSSTNSASSSDPASSSDSTNAASAAQQPFEATAAPEAMEDDAEASSAEDSDLAADADEQRLRLAQFLKRR